MKEGTFIVRESVTNPGEFSLSVVTHGAIMHIR
jgi:hypothetical protein